MSPESIQHWCWIYSRVAQDKDCEAQLHGVALTKLVAHMEDFRKNIFPVFKLTDLIKLYKNWLKLFGVVF